MKLFSSIPALVLALCLCGLNASASAPNLDWDINFKVQPGDCLWKIAGISFNDPFLWPLIYHANEGLIKNPDLIQPGWRLSMPLDPSDLEMASAVQMARLYKESMPLPARATASLPPAAVPAPRVAEEATGPVEARMPFDMSDLTAIGYALYLLMLAAGVAVLGLMHMFESPHHEKEMVNPMGLHLAPWASINEISGTAQPEMEELELQEAA